MSSSTTIRCLVWGLLTPLAAATLACAPSARADAPVPSSLAASATSAADAGTATNPATPAATATPAALATAVRRATAATDAMTALASPEAAPRYDLAFWLPQQAGRTALWFQACVYCRLPLRRPNCGAVRLASWWSPAATPTPPLTLFLPGDQVATALAPAHRPGTHPSGLGNSTGPSPRRP